jgi:hypothetical protein
MKKIAIFVEGMTEQEFAVDLVSALAGAKGLHVVLSRQWRGKVAITPTVAPAGTNFYALIIDCSSDEQVKSQIREQYPTLIARGFTAIIGLRDVYPRPRVEIPKIQAMLAAGLPKGPVVPQIHLAVMEIEAWFLSETSHFAQINKTLTVPYIVSRGFNIAAYPGDSWDHPAFVLDGIYKLVKLRYMDSRRRKTKSRVRRTLNALSFDELYLTVRHRLPHLDSFVTCVERALL